MNPIYNATASLTEHEGDRMVPPGGGLMIAIVVSFVFWGALVWMIL